LCHCSALSHSIHDNNVVAIISDAVSAVCLYIAVFGVFIKSSDLREKFKTMHGYRNIGDNVFVDCDEGGRK